MTLKLYASVLVFPLIAAVGLWLGGAFVWLLPAVAFGTIPLAELLMNPVTENLTKDQEQALPRTKKEAAGCAADKQEEKSASSAPIAGEGIHNGRSRTQSIAKGLSPRTRPATLSRRCKSEGAYKNDR